MTSPLITTIVLHHPARPVRCLLRTLAALDTATKVPHRVELVIQGPLRPGVSIPKNSAFDFDLQVFQNKKNVGLSAPLHDSIERLESPWWGKVDDDIYLPPGGWDILRMAIEHERKLGKFKIGAGFISPGDIPPRLLRVVEGDVLEFYTGQHVVRKTPNATWHVCDYSGMGITLIPRDTFTQAKILPDPRYFVSGENLDFAYQMHLKGIRYVHVMRPRSEHDKGNCHNAEYNQDRWSTHHISHSARLFQSKFGLRNRPLWNAAGLPFDECTEGEVKAKPVLPKGQARVIGIIGRSFCGSTLLSRLLAAIDNVGAAGELHWVLDAPAVGGAKTRAGWTVTRRCVQCGKECPVFTDKLIMNPPKRETLYQQVAKKMGVTALVVSDKVPGHFAHCCQKKCLDAIVMFKSPHAAALSDMKNEGQTVEEAITGYIGTYENILRWCPKYCNRVIYVSYEDVAQDPWGMTIKIKQALGIPGPPPREAAFAEANYHAVGGNPKAHKRVDISVDERWKTQLPEAAKRVINANVRQRQMYAKLMELRVR